MSSVKKRFCFLILLLGMLVFSGACVASAQTVNVVKSAQTVQGGKWVKTASGRKYRLKGGTYARNIWLRIGTQVSYFNEKGICQTGWFSYGGKRYYADKNGKIYISRFRTAGSAKCYFKSDGSLAVNCWQKLSGKYYYFLSTGKMAVDTFVTTGNKTYYVNSSGVRVCSAWVKKDGKSYYLNKSGVMQKSCWLHLKKKYYYVDEDGVRQESCWCYLNARYYYFKSNGVMAQSCWIDGYYVGADGVRKTDCIIGNYYYDGTGKKSQSVSTGKYIIVGDSRIVGMSRAVSDTDTKFLALSGKGYTWLKNTCASQLAKCLNANPDVSVVLCLGVNDLENIDSYIAYYRKLILQYPDTRFYMLSVNPVIESLASQFRYSRTNEKICAFNEKLQEAFPSRYIDSYSYLQKYGFESTDGVHYLSATNKILYSYIISRIE